MGLSVSRSKTKESKGTIIFHIIATYIDSRSEEGEGEGEREREMDEGRENTRIAIPVRRPSPPETNGRYFYDADEVESVYSTSSDETSEEKDMYGSHEKKRTPAKHTTRSLPEKSKKVRGTLEETEKEEREEKECKSQDVRKAKHVSNALYRFEKFETYSPRNGE